MSKYTFTQSILLRSQEALQCPKTMVNHHSLRICCFDLFTKISEILISDKVLTFCVEEVNTIYLIKAEKLDCTGRNH
jgi:hypothetical protein